MAARNPCSRFIPLRTPELLELACRDRSIVEQDQEALEQLGSLLSEVHHARSHSRLVELKEAYAPFDPDTDETTVSRLAAAQKQSQLNDLLADLRWVLGRASYRHLCREEIESALAGSSDWGINMRVNFNLFEHVAIFVRGESHQTRKLCNWTTLFQEKEIELPVYRRLALILKLRANPKLPPSVSSDQLYLKIFKDIPRADVDMLLPGGRVRLNWIDHGKLGVGILSGIGMLAYRMLWDVAAFLHNIETALLGVIASAAGYGSKSYFDYQNTRQSYHLNLTQSLYFQNLDSNAGVLNRLMDDAEEQETRTAMLAYFCLWKYAGADGFNDEELEAVMGLFLDRYAEVPFLSDPGEPLALLQGLGLAEGGNKRYRPVPLARAVEQLRLGRDQRRSCGPTTGSQPKQTASLTKNSTS